MTPTELQEKVTAIIERAISSSHPGNICYSDELAKALLASGLLVDAELLRDLLINRMCGCGGWACPRCAVSIELAQVALALPAETTPEVSCTCPGRRVPQHLPNCPLGAETKGTRKP